MKGQEGVMQEVWRLWECGEGSFPRGKGILGRDNRKEASWPFPSTVGKVEERNVEAGACVRL